MITKKQCKSKAKISLSVRDTPEVNKKAKSISFLIITWEIQQKQYGKWWKYLSHGWIKNNVEERSISQTKTKQKTIKRKQSVGTGNKGKVERTIDIRNETLEPFVCILVKLNCHDREMEIEDQRKQHEKIMWLTWPFPIIFGLPNDGVNCEPHQDMWNNTKQKSNHE